MLRPFLFPGCYARAPQVNILFRIRPRLLPNAPGAAIASRRLHRMRFLRSERYAAFLLIGAAALGLALANTPWAAALHSVRDLHPLAFGPGLDLSLGHWVTDGLLAVFFFLAAIELRHELTHGELDSPRKALVPALAAVGGVIVPALIFLAIVREPGLSSGWPIPTATDIAFALGVLALAGRGLPPRIRALLLGVAVIDDLERRGWVTRARAADDRRRYVLHIAPAGKRALDDLVDRTREIEDRVLAALTDAERRRLFATLDKLVERVLANEP